MALLRMTVDPELVGRGGLYPDLRAALEAALGPWEGAVWARVAHDTARAVAELGPSHRAGWRAISRCHGVSQHVRYWQQCAAMELLRGLVPQVRARRQGWPACCGSLEYEFIQVLV